MINLFKMQRRSENNFLRRYYPILEHHMTCILESGMLLDEDLYLLISFWSPLTPTPRSIHAAVLCTVSACTGAALSTRFNNIYPLLASLAPAAAQLSYKTLIFYHTRKYKANCLKLLSLFAELRELNRDILQHSNGFMLNLSKASSNPYVLLRKTRCEFLKSVTTTLIGILKDIVGKMHEISKLVPVTEGKYIYASEWDFEHFMLKSPQAELGELLHHFESVTDLSVLIISNFLASLGLIFCNQLWKDTSVNLKPVFDVVIPGLCGSLDVSIKSIKDTFCGMKYSLSTTIPTCKRPLRKSAVLQRPIDDFLLNTQLLFELGKHIQTLLEVEMLDVSELSLALGQTKAQFVKCSDSLDFIDKLHGRAPRPVVVCNPETVQSALQTFPTEIVYLDDVEVPLEDEEYSLSIHEIDSDDDDEVPVIDYDEKCSSDDVDAMFVELRRKLDERRIKKGLAVEPEVRKEVVAPPPPPPVVPCLPTLDNSHQDFLNAVRAIAQNLNREEEFQFGFNVFPDIPRQFNTTYRCFSVAMLPGNERQDVERGGKIIMPPSALEQLTRLNINYPMLFKIVNKKTSRTSHCGVLEFVADEGKVYLPLWLMHNLVLEEGDLIQIESVSLPVGKFAKFQPLSPEFLDITNPKAVLENCLRTFACLTTGDVIAVKYNQKAYELCVLETQPGNAISIIECDMNVEFAAPIGYKEAEDTKPNEEEMAVDPADLMPEPSGFVAFKGTGNRLDGKRRKDSATTDMPINKPVYVRGIPDYDYQIGTLRFLRNVIKLPAVDKEENPEFKVFSGKGFSLKRGGK